MDASVPMPCVSIKPMSSDSVILGGATCAGCRATPATASVETVSSVSRRPGSLVKKRSPGAALRHHLGPPRSFHHTRKRVEQLAARLENVVCCSTTQSRARRRRRSGGPPGRTRATRRRRRRRSGNEPPTRRDRGVVARVHAAARHAESLLRERFRRVVRSLASRVSLGAVRVRRGRAHLRHKRVPQFGVQRDTRGISWKSNPFGRRVDSVRGYEMCPSMYRRSAICITRCAPIPSPFEHDFNRSTVFKPGGRCNAFRRDGRSDARDFPTRARPP